MRGAAPAPPLPPPQTHGPQSIGQVMHVSVPLHKLSPQHGLQSMGQLMHVAPPSQKPAPPTRPHGPQSLGQLMHVSEPLQKVSPQPWHMLPAQLRPPPHSHPLELDPSQFE